MSGTFTGDVLHTRTGTYDRAALAAWVLTHGGDQDVVDALGLGEPQAPATGRQTCPKCGGPLPDPLVNGGFKACRRRGCIGTTKPKAGAEG